MSQGIRRIGGACGLAFVVLFVGSLLTTGEPSRTASKEEIARYIAGHQVTLEVAGAAVMIVSGVFALFAIGVWALLRSSPGHEVAPWPMTALVGGLVMAVNFAFSGAALATEGWMSDGLGGQPVLAKAIFTWEQTVGTAILPFIALFLLGLGMATLESRALPTWTAWLAFLGAALSVVLVLQLLSPGKILDGIGIVHAVVVLGLIAIVAGYMLLPQRAAAVTGPHTAGAAHA